MLAGMTRLLPVVSAVFLFSLGAHAQAVVSPPPRPPAVRPVVNPPDFPTPGATPAGAGLPGERVPGATVVPVKRSPNTRALPDDFSPTKEPGVWAADGETRAAARRQLWGVVVPLPNGEMADSVEFETWNCAGGMEESAVAARADHLVRAFPGAALRCAVATAHHHCALYESARARRKKAAGEEFLPDRNRVLEAALAHAAALRAAWCAGVAMSDQQRNVLADVLRAWKRDIQQER
jgi:hypothetical protein